MNAAEAVKLQDVVAELYRQALPGSCVDPAVNSWI